MYPLYPFGLLLQKRGAIAPKLSIMEGYKRYMGMYPLPKNVPISAIIETELWIVSQGL